MRRAGVLPGHQLAVGQHIGAPVRPLGVVAAVGGQHVLDQERHHVGQAHGFLFGVGEAGHLAAVDQRLAVRPVHRLQHTGRMADEAGRLVRLGEGLDQGDGVGVVRQIPQRSVSAGIKDGVEILGLHRRQDDGRGQGGLGFGVGLEPARVVGLGVGVVALGIQRRLTALGRGQHDLRARILQRVIGRRQFFQPEAGLLARVAELIVRRQHQQNFHRGWLRLGVSTDGKPHGAAQGWPRCRKHPTLKALISGDDVA